MANELIQPHGNPIPFFKQVPDENPQYATRFFDAWPYEQTILPWEQPVGYCQPFQTNDSLRLQFQSNYGPIKATLIEEGGREYNLGNFDQKQSSVDRPGFYIYECDYALNIYPEGCYLLKLDIGSPVSLSLVSPPLHIRTKHLHSLQFVYKHFQFKDDLIFETGFLPVKRVHGLLRYKSPARKDTLFEDQPLNQSLVRSRHYRLWEMYVGSYNPLGSSLYGIPPFEMDIVDRILGCSDVQIDGRYFTVSESKWDYQEEDNYPLRVGKIELREKLNKTTGTYQNNVLQQRRIGVVINTDSKGFASDDSGGSVYQILDIQ